MVRIAYVLKLIAAALVAGTATAGSQPSLGAAKWRAILGPVGGARVRGGAIAEAKSAESTRFTVTIRDAPANVTLAWHMHSGTCASPGGVVGSGYPELRSGPGGTAEAAVVVAVAPPEQGDFVVQVHGANGSPIACGELKRIGEPGTQ